MAATDRVPERFFLSIRSELVEGAHDNRRYVIKKDGDSISFTLDWTRAGKRAIHVERKLSSDEFRGIWAELVRAKALEKDFSKLDFIKGSHFCELEIEVNGKKIIDYHHRQGADDEGGRLFAILWKRVDSLERSASKTRF